MTSLKDRWRRFTNPWPEERFTQPGEYRVVLQVTGPKPVLVVRELRRITGLGLLEAKQLADRAPITVAQRISEASAAGAVGLLVAAGARAVLREDDVT